MTLLWRLTRACIVVGACLFGVVSTLYAVPLDLSALPSSDIEQVANALTVQAQAYEYGDAETVQDHACAKLFYCEAARLGHAGAAFALGWMYANGRGGPKDDALAATFFKIAATGEIQQAQTMLALLGDISVPVGCLRTPAAEFILAPWNIEMLLSVYSPQQRSVARAVMAEALRLGVAPRLALAVAETESGFNPEAVSAKNAYGVMQLRPATAARFQVNDILDVRDNIAGGLRYLQWLLVRFDGDLPRALAAYNAGEQAVEQYGGIPPYPETQAYVKKILHKLKSTQDFAE